MCSVQFVSMILQKSPGLFENKPGDNIVIFPCNINVWFKLQQVITGSELYLQALGRGPT